MSSSGRMSIRRRRHHGGVFISGRGASTAVAVPDGATLAGARPGGMETGGVLAGRSIGVTSAAGERIGESGVDGVITIGGGALGGCDGEFVGATDGALAGITPIPAYVEPASALTKSPQRGKRSSGRFASARKSAASTPGGSETPSVLGIGTGLCTCAMSAESGLSAGNGWRPTSIWYAMIP